MELPAFDLGTVASHLIRLAAAFVLALPIGWDREKSERRRLGLRTFPLVSMASCGYVLVARAAVGDAELARVIQGLITGIGFLGGGAIVKSGLDVYGTATAASIWTTAAIGAAVSCNRYDIAVVLTAVTFISLYWLTPLKKQVREDADE